MEYLPAPPLENVLERLPHEALVSAPPRPQTKRPEVNKNLDVNEFTGENWMCLAAAQASSGRFKAFRFIGRFMLNFVWGSAYPEDVLKALFSMSLAYAVKGTKGMKIVADHFIFLLPSICEESFVIDITAIDSEGKRKKLAGRGRPKEFSINYTIHQGATFELTNNDNLCLFRAFEFLRMKFVLPQQRFSEYKRAASWQLNDVSVLCEACNIDLDQPFYSVEEYGERIQAFYEQLHPGMFRLFCFETSGKMKPYWKTEVEDYQNELCVLFTEGVDGAAGHYDPIKSMGKIFNNNGNYCFGCEMPYLQPNRHNANCKWKCHNCQRVGNLFRGNCYNKNGTFLKHAWPALQDKQKGHQCGQKFCRVCLGFHAPRDCYIPYRPKAKKEKLFIFFDFECTTDFKPDPEILRFKHQVNFCYAHVTCTRCIEKDVWDKDLEKACALCGPLRFYSWAPFHYDNTDVDRHFRVDDPLAAFTKWLLHFESETLGVDPNDRRKRKRAPAKNSNILAEEVDDAESDDDDDNNWMIFGEKGEKPVSVTTYAYAHAGSRYDHVLVYGEMLRMGVCPDLVRQGNHLLEMRAPKKGGITATVFRDSYKLIPVKLAAFVKTFGLEIDGVENKKYFPHKFNKEANYDTALETLPPLEMYYPGGHFPEERKKLERWHRENFNTPFVLREVIADYCKTDVQILAHGVIKMRELFYNETFDDITDSVTIPWRAEEEMRENGLTLRHVESPGGEYKFGNYSLDGMLERPGQGNNLAIEVNGCFWHACPNCFPDAAAIVAGGETAGAIRARDAKRIAQIAREFEVEIIWECHLNRLLEDTPAMKAFFDNTPDSGPIDFHDAFFGGRTGPEWLGASVILETGELLPRTIKIKDFNSLYPSRNMFTSYPVGHPTLIHFDKDVNWCKPIFLCNEHCSFPSA
uniref:DNA-directed DNA polymerase n=1 Tax=Globodera rostochiensis TaxID=31243 RepID=A0A914I8L3_GLORO